MVRIPPGVGHRSVPAFLLTALLTLLTACGGSANGADSGERATVPSAADPIDAVSTTTAEAPEMTVEEEVEAAYLEAERQFMVFMENPSGSDDFLERTRTGHALTFVRNSVEERRESGEYTSYPSGYTASKVLDVDVSGSEGRLTACLEDDAVVLSSTGKVVDGAIETVLFDIKMIEKSGSWLVAEQTVTEVKQGRVPCDQF